MSPSEPSLFKVGHSPDPDDAFMFYALAKGKILLEGFEIEHVIEDIERLNERALGVGAYGHTPPLEVTALSCHAFAYVTDRYNLLPYGASVGEDYGPIVVAKSPLTPTLSPEGRGRKEFISSPPLGERNKVRGSIRGARIAVPGRYTTAFLALQLHEKDFEPVFTPFDQIFDVLREGKADLGLLIHEGQLTYQELGFEKVLDLGEWWQETQGLPLPLGINAIRKDLDPEIQSRFSRLFQKSIDYAMAHREEALGYALKFGRGIDRKRGDRFVGMYVNDFSLDLGERGVRGLRTLLDQGWKNKIFPFPVTFEVSPSLTQKGS